MGHSIYIHYPFCKSKCPYCDFNSFCNINISENDLIKSYLLEIDYYKKYIYNKNIDTIYFGGGTPSLMTENLLASILKKIFNEFKIDKNCEITLEANPNSISFEKLKNFKNIGINRLSIGVQSLYDEDLKKLGRIHNRIDSLNAINIAQNIFNDKYSIDLIYTRNNQSIESWIKELTEAIKLSPFHLSLYQLIIEKGTIFYKNKVSIPEEDLSLKFYNITRDILEGSGINFYEISNYSKNGYESNHNLKYWTNGEWLGIGAGAHSRINYNGKRYAIQNIKNPIKWVEKITNKKNSISIKSILNTKEIIEEFVIMGLRIKDGININNLQKNIDIESFYNILNKKNIDLLVKNQLIIANEKNIKLTKKGFPILNAIIEKIL